MPIIIQILYSGLDIEILSVRSLETQSQANPSKYSKNHLPTYCSASTVQKSTGTCNDKRYVYCAERSLIHEAEVQYCISGNDKTGGFKPSRMTTLHE